MRDLSWLAAYGIVIMLGLVAAGAVSSCTQRWGDADARSQAQLRQDQAQEDQAQALRRPCEKRSRCPGCEFEVYCPPPEGNLK